MAQYWSHIGTLTCHKAIVIAFITVVHNTICLFSSMHLVTSKIFAVPTLMTLACISCVAYYLSEEKYLKRAPDLTSCAPNLTSCAPIQAAINRGAQHETIHKSGKLLTIIIIIAK